MVKGTKCIRMGTHISESSREGRLRGTVSMFGQIRESHMRANGTKGGSMDMGSGQELMETHTLDNGKIVSHTDSECRLHLTGTDMKESGITLLNMEKELKCIRMGMCILETTEKGFLTALESISGLTRAILREPL